MPIDNIKTIQVKDRSGDGYIDRDEFNAALKASNLRSASNYQITHSAYIEANTGNPSNIELAFNDYYSNYIPAEQEFDNVDTKKDQILSKEEIAEIFKNGGRVRVKEQGSSIPVEIITAIPYKEVFLNPSVE